MNNLLFQQFLKNVQFDERVLWDSELSKPYAEIINLIYTDVAKFKNYTLDGRLQDILIKLLKNPKYESEGYSSLLEDLESALNQLVVTNLILLPINFIERSKFQGDTKLNEYINLFLPTKEDIIELNDSTLRMRQEKRQRDKTGKMSDNLCKYFETELYNKLDKEHILIAKDRSFFNYPILSIKINNIDYKVEKESGRIAQAVYSILRMIDFIKDREPYSWGILNRNWTNPAHTYVVYYNKENHKLTHEFNDGYYGYSFMCNFSYFLDISTVNFIENIDLFTQIINLYISSCFLDLRKYNDTQLKIINKWNNAISMYNTAYEFASIEKYDACNLVICALLESLFLKNEGRNKQERLIVATSEYLKGIYSDEGINVIIDSLQNIYQYRNKIMHEGSGYESKYMSSRRLHDYQGIYRGMRPFSYNGAVYPDKDIGAIKKILKCVADILICDKTLKNIEEAIKFKN